MDNNHNLVNIVEFEKEDIENKKIISSLMSDSLILEYGNPPNEGYLDELLNYYFGREDTKIFFLLDNNIFAGFIWLIKSEDVVTSKFFTCILYLYVDENFRGKGYSKILMNKAKEYCKSIEITQLRLAVRHNNPVAIDLYNNLGYKTYKHEMLLDI